MGWESIKCSVDSGHLRPGRRLGELSIILPEIVAPDFQWTWTSECLIHDHVLEVFRDLNLTGFDVKPCKARFRSDVGRKPPRLWEFIVTGWGGIASETSGIRLISSCDGCNHQVYSTYCDAKKLIDAERWDGSDFFIVWPLPKFIFMTDRVASIIREAKWQDVQILSLADLEVRAEAKRSYTDTGSTLSPGRLSYFMPDERARRLGFPLGIY